jgi:chaperonin GroES
MNVLHDRVLLKRFEPEKKTSGGIVLHSAIDATYEADVIKVGTGKQVKDGKTLPLTVKVGDRVMYNPTAVVKVKLEGEEYLVTKEEEIYAILEQD